MQGVYILGITYWKTDFNLLAIFSLGADDHNLLREQSQLYFYFLRFFSTFASFNPIRSFLFVLGQRNMVVSKRLNKLNRSSAHISLHIGQHVVNNRWKDLNAAIVLKHTNENQDVLHNRLNHIRTNL